MGARGDGRGPAIGTAAVREAGAPRADGRRTGRLGAALLVAKPGIVLGVSLAGFAGMALAARGIPEARTAVLGLFSLLAAASGAAILNGLLEGESDARMPRLARRVAALETVGRRGAAALAAALVAAGVLSAFAALNPLSGLLVLSAVASYALLYTLRWKRRSPYGTVPGGIPGALPVLAGYAAVAGRIGFDGIGLFLVMLLWQPPHFWTLALRCREEYAAAEIPALPVARGEPFTKALVFAYAVALLPASLALWVFGFLSGRFAAAAALLWAGFLLSCYRNAVAARRYGRAFGASILYITLLLAAVVADLAAR